MDVLHLRGLLPRGYLYGIPLTLLFHPAMPRLLLAALLLTCLACDANDEEVVAEPAVPVRTFDVRYVVEGTYTGDGCAIVYAAADRTEATREQQDLPWEQIERVEIARSGPQSVFNASLSATCSDPLREGKVTAALYVDGAQRQIQTSTGPGETVTVRFRITG